MSKAPCIECKERHPACQDTCKKLKRYKHLLNECKKQMKEIKEKYDN